MIGCGRLYKCDECPDKDHCLVLCKVEDFAVGRDCIICEKFFPIYHVEDNRRICPECCSRLKKILYPEEEQ